MILDEPERLITLVVFLAFKIAEGLVGMLPVFGGEVENVAEEELDRGLEGDDEKLDVTTGLSDGGESMFEGVDCGRTTAVVEPVTLEGCKVRRAGSMFKR